MFLLATKNYLGDLVYIELWIDGVGVNPNWTCDFITIFDMQQKIKWKFEMKKTLAVKSNQAYLAVASERDDSNTNPKIASKEWKYLWCLWQNTDDFTYMNKLSVLFSKILSIFAICFLLGHFPELKMRDVLDLEQYRIAGIDMGIGFSSSLIAFVIHQTIILGFR